MKNVKKKIGQLIGDNETKSEINEHIAQQKHEYKKKKTAFVIQQQKHLYEINEMQMHHNQVRATMEQSQQQQLLTQKHELNAIERQKEYDREIYNQQLQYQQHNQQNISKQLETMRNWNTDLQDRLNKRQNKIKQQLEKKINDLKAQKIESQQEHDKKLQKIVEINNEKLKQLEVSRNEDRKKQQQQMIMIAKQNEKNYKQLKKDELKNRLIEIQKLIIAQILQYQKKMEVTKQTFESYKHEVIQISKEEKRLKTFEPEKADPNLLNIVLLGITGHGKSTLACRLAGDKSVKCDLGIFKHNADLISVTQGIKKQICHNVWSTDISIVDTPGIFDSGGNDAHHANNLVQFLKGCGGVNAFILVKTKIPPRFDKSFQDTLESLEIMLGREFWKYVIIVITHVKKNDEINFDKYSKELRNLMYKEMGLNKDDAPLPCIGIDSFQNYEDPLKELIANISNEKFQCSELRSPLQQLKVQNELSKKEFDSMRYDLDSIKQVILTANNQYKQVDKFLSEMDSNHKTSDIDVSIINDGNDEQWEIKIELTPEPETKENNEEQKQGQSAPDLKENMEEDHWIEIDVKKYSFRGELKHDEETLNLEDSKFKAPDFEIKLNQNDDKYDEYVEIFEQADDDGDDVTVVIKECYFKNNSGKQKIERSIESIQIV